VDAALEVQAHLDLVAQRGRQEEAQAEDGHDDDYFPAESFLHRISLSKVATFLY
jgi:hypothetical protein